MRTLIVILCVALCFASCRSRRNNDALSEEDRKQIMAALKNYRDAWIKNDTATIMNFVSQEMIIYMPGAKGKPKIGKDSIRKFWFPGSDLSYPITEYVDSKEQLEGDGRFCIYSGISKLSWHKLKGTIRSDSTTVVSEFLNLLRKEGGQWKLFRIMYNIKDNDYK